MKNLIILTIALVFIGINLNAQECSKEEKREKIQAKKVAFLTEKLDLSVEEAQKFWPLYNEQEKEFEKLHNERRSLMKDIHGNIETMSDKELEEKTSRLININLDEAKLQLEYYEKFKKILSIKKIFILHHSEKEFNHTLLRELKGPGEHHPKR